MSLVFFPIQVWPSLSEGVPSKSSLQADVIERISHRYPETESGRDLKVTDIALNCTQKLSGNSWKKAF